MIYLDAAATSAVRREVLEAMWPYLTGDFGNPSSHHAVGESAVHRGHTSGVPKPGPLRSAAGASVTAVTSAHLRTSRPDVRLRGSAPLLRPGQRRLVPARRAQAHPGEGRRTRIHVLHAS